MDSSSCFVFFSFTINTIGEISTTRRLDRETQDRYEFSVFINDVSNDQTGPSRQGAAKVIVIVRDKDDNNPRFVQTSYTGSFFENVPLQTPILTVTVSYPVRNILI